MSSLCPHILLYTLILMAATLLPYVYGMSGRDLPGVGLGVGACSWHAYQLWKQYSDALGAQNLQVFHRPPDVDVCRRCWWTTTTRSIMMTQPPGQTAAGSVTWLLAALAALSLQACKTHRFAHAAAGASSQVTEAARFNAVDITGAEYARKLQLKDVDGKPRVHRRVQGKVVFLFLRLHAVPRCVPPPPWQTWPPYAKARP